jgi:Ca2+-transporting ATPase
VWALRDGRLVQVPSASIVPGDVVRLEAGDRIPADGALIEANGFMVDESVLTGESLPLEKTPGEEVLAGTLAVRGTAFIELARTGAKSHLGKLATLVGRVEAGKTPLETGCSVSASSSSRPAYSPKESARSTACFSSRWRWPCRPCRKACRRS